MLHFKEGTLPRSHRNLSSKECPFSVHDQWEYPHPKIYHVAYGTKIGCVKVWY